jgi:hypothetical protein
MRHACLQYLIGEPEGKRKLGGLQGIWENNIKMYLKQTGYEDVKWVQLA